MKSGSRTLQDAFQSGNSSTTLRQLKDLLAEGVPLNDPNPDGAVHLLTCAFVYPPVLKYLIAQGIEVDRKDRQGRTALMTSIDRADGNSKRIVAGGKIYLSAQPDLSLREPGFGETVLGMAVRMGQDRWIKLLLAEGADANLADRSGRTPLFSAIENGALGTVKLLLDCRATVNVQDGNGQTPLDFLRAPQPIQVRGMRKVARAPTVSAASAKIEKLLLARGARPAPAKKSSPKKGR